MLECGWLAPAVSAPVENRERGSEEGYTYVPAQQSDHVQKEGGGGGAAVNMLLYSDHYHKAQA